MHSYLHELRLLAKGLIKWTIYFFLLSAVFFSVGWGRSTILGHSFPSPVFTSDAIAAQVFHHMVAKLLPAGVHLIVQDPLDAFLIEAEVSLTLAFVVLLPFAIAGLMRYFAPALSRRERRALSLMILPALLLFFLGMLFSYFFVLPELYSFLVLYVPAVGAQPLFSAQAFYDSVMGLLIASGFMFELPICMVLLSGIGILPASFWREHWRAAVLTVLIVTAIITPDGSGISMLILSAPLLALYFLGASVSEWRRRRKLALSA